MANLNLNDKFLTQTPTNTYSNATIVNLMRSIQCTLSSLGLLDHFVVQNSFKIFIRTLRHINTQEGKIVYTEKEQLMYEQKSKYIQRKNAQIQRVTQEEDISDFQQISVPIPPVVIQDPTPPPVTAPIQIEQIQKKRKPVQVTTEKKQSNEIQDENQVFAQETKQLLDLVENGLLEIDLLQHDYSFQQLNERLDMNELESIFDNFHKVKWAIDNKEITPENIRDYIILNIQTCEKLVKVEESIKGKCKLAPTKEEVQRRRKQDRAISKARKRATDYYK